MARKLKGKNAEKLKGSKKEKMEKTLKRMDKVRKEDTIRLRIRIEEKIKSHEVEIVKAAGYRESLNKKIESIKEMELKLEGAVISLKEILNNAIETESNS